LGLSEREGPGRSDRTARVTTLRQVVSEREDIFSFSSREGEEFNMSPRRERQSPDREDRDARRRGRPTGNLEMECQMRDLQVRLEEMETA
jgi:hypothetical protein